MSQKSDVLNYMQKGNSITSLECINLFHATRLASLVGALRKSGYPVKDEWVHRGKKSYKKYFMEVV